MKIIIEHKEKQSEDIFTPGNIVVSKGQVMLVTDGKAQTENTFCGIVIESTYYYFGKWDNDWAKEHFTKFVGTITLEQE